MSADNGIYILKTKDQYRVVHSMAFENIYHSFSNPFQTHREPVPTRLVAKYGRTRYTRDFEKALQVANAMLKDIHICEYGIQIVQIHKSWDQIVRDAKALAPSEIQAIKKNNHSWDQWHIQELENILSM